MSQIEELVLSELRKQPELEAIDRGFRWQRGEDATRLWFCSTSAPGDFGLCATAWIETVFGPRIEAPDLVELGRLNRRACFGSYFSSNGRLGMRASYCIYEKEPASTWVAIALLRAMGEQLALGIGIAHSEFVSASLAGSRANLEYPRSWGRTAHTLGFEQIAASFRERGLMATHGSHGLVLEVPLAGISASRMLDPKAETALLHLSMDVPHPIAGVGYAATIAFPIDPPSAKIPSICQALNQAEHAMQDFVPRLGAWGMRSLDSELVYSLFWPTDQADEGLVITIMSWMITRTLWIKSQYWEPGSGLTKLGGAIA